MYCAVVEDNGAECKGINCKAPVSVSIRNDRNEVENEVEIKLIKSKFNRD